MKSKFESYSEAHEDEGEIKGMAAVAAAISMMVTFIGFLYLVGMWLR